MWHLHLWSVCLLSFHLVINQTGSRMEPWELCRKPLRRLTSVVMSWTQPLWEGRSAEQGSIHYPPLGLPDSPYTYFPSYFCLLYLSPETYLFVYIYLCRSSWWPFFSFLPLPVSIWSSQLYPGFLGNRLKVCWHLSCPSQRCLTQSVRLSLPAKLRPMCDFSPCHPDWVSHMSYDIHPILNTLWIQLLSQLQIHKITALIQPTFHHLSHKETKRGTVNPKLKSRTAMFTAYTWLANIVTLSKEEMRLVWNNLYSVKSFCFQVTTTFLPKCSPTICFLIHSASLLSRIYLKLTCLEFPETIFFPFMKIRIISAQFLLLAPPSILHNYLKVTDSGSPVPPERSFHTSGCESLGQTLGPIQLSFLPPSYLISSSVLSSEPVRTP